MKFQNISKEFKAAFKAIKNMDWTKWIGVILFLPIILGLLFSHNYEATSWKMVQHLFVAFTSSFLSSGILFGFKGYKSPFSAGTIGRTPEMSNTQFFFMVSLIAQLLGIIFLPNLS